MSPRADRPSVRSRVTLALGVASLAMVAAAAKMPAPVSITASAQQQVPPMTPPAAQPPSVPVTLPDSLQTIPDSLRMGTDSMMTDSMMMSTEMPPSVEVAPAAPASWPVDPVTGQTLINGIPVVGRVFVQQKVDGLVKIESVAAALAIEPPTAAAPIVKLTQYPQPAAQTRRQRQIMVQATLWGSDDKPSAVQRRHYIPTTSGASLGQR